MCLWCSWKDLDEQDLTEFIWYNLDSECGRDIDFYMISAAEILNKFQKTRFWKEKSVEDEFTLGPRA